MNPMQLPANRQTPQQGTARAAHAKQARQLELDGLRAFAILPVLLLHFAPSTGPLRWLGPLCLGGWTGVDLFFVMSGFLITGVLLDNVGHPHYYRNFLARRALRILPLYYLCLAVFTAAVYFSPGKADWHSFLRWGSPLWFVFYLGNIRAALNGAPPPNASFVPLWSLQVEEQYYLTYPMIIAMCSRATLRKLLIGAILAAPVLRCLAFLVLPESSFLSFYVLTPFRMDALAMGGLIALMLREGGLPFSKGQLQAVVLICFSLVAAIFVFLSTDPTGKLMRTVGYSVIDLGCAALLALVVTSAGSRAVAILRRQPLVYIGQIAYGLYLLHAPTSFVMRAVLSRRFHIEPHGSWNFVLSLSAAFAVAGLSWFLFESRILALKDRFSRS